MHWAAMTTHQYNTLDHMQEHFTEKLILTLNEIILYKELSFLVTHFTQQLFLYVAGQPFCMMMVSSADSGTECRNLLYFEAWNSAGGWEMKFCRGSLCFDY